MARNAQNTARLAIEKVGEPNEAALALFDEQFAKYYLGRHDNGEGRTMKRLADVFRYSRGGGTDNRLASGNFLGLTQRRGQTFKLTPSR